MKAILVVKRTSYELDCARRARRLAGGRFSEEGLRRLEAAHRQHHETLERLRRGLEARRIKHGEFDRQDVDLPGLQTDVVISVGGDGTALRASHSMVRGGVLVGVRSSDASVGFLCAGAPVNLDWLLDSLQEDRLPLVEVHRLRGAIRRVDGSSEETPPILNDLLFTNRNPAATTRYALQYGSTTEQQKSSGIWIATAAGSTAAIHAAGGRRLPLADPRFQFRVREPYQLKGQPLELTAGIFAPENIRFLVKNGTVDAVLALDGHHGAVAVGYGDEVLVRRAPTLFLAAPQGL